MLRWAAEQDVELHFIAPGKPTQNGNIESLNGKIRDELFNMHRFHDDLRGSSQGRRMENGLQRGSTALGAWIPDAQGVCRSLQNQPTLTVVSCLKSTLRSTVRASTSSAVRPIEADDDSIGIVCVKSCFLRPTTGRICINVDRARVILKRTGYDHPIPVDKELPNAP